MAVSVSNNFGIVEFNDASPLSDRKGSNVVKFEDRELLSVKFDNGNSVN